MITYLDETSLQDPWKRRLFLEKLNIDHQIFVKFKFKFFLLIC